MIEQIILNICLLISPETIYLCKERVEACYYRQIEISEEPKEEIIRLCLNTYLENNTTE